MVLTLVDACVHTAPPRDRRPDAHRAGSPEPDGLEPGDQELLIRLRAGDRSAFARLYERHAPAAHRYARRLAPGQADDVVSEALTATLEAIDRGYGPSDDLRPYLFTAVRRQAARARRRREQPAEHDEMADPTDITLAIEATDSDVLDAFAELPARWREVMVAVDLDGFAVQDVAAQMGLSPNAVSALLYRARAGLRQIYVARRDRCEGTGVDDVA
jgi:RNA polymerase sigma factor (sigma-70 family)